MESMKTLRALVAAGVVIASFGVAVAKLPAPTEEQKKAAEEKKAKDAVAAEAAKAALSRAEDRTVARYHADMKAKGKEVPPPQMGPSTDGGKGGAAVSSKPEKQMVHSPPETKR